MSNRHTSPPASDTSPFGFGRFVPGFDFLQNLAKGASAGMPQMPSLSGWVAPTISVEELEKRIEELKAVQFWLDQNSRALSATVQALEVQKMTLATLQGMNVAMGDLAKAFTPPSTAPSPSQDPRAQAASASAPAPQVPRPDPFARAQPAAQAPSAAQPAPGGEPAGAPAPGAAAAGAASAPGVVDPMQWWTALTGQFQQIAVNAMSDVSKLPAMDATRGMAAEALKTATDMATQFAAQGMQGMQEAARKASGVPADSTQGSRGAAKRAAPEGAQAGPDAPPAAKPRAKKTPGADAPPAAAARRAAGPRNRS